MLITREVWHLLILVVSGTPHLGRTSDAWLHHDSRSRDDSV